MLRLIQGVVVAISTSCLFVPQIHLLEETVFLSWSYINLKQFIPCFVWLLIAYHILNKTIIKIVSMFCCLVIKNTFLTDVTSLNHLLTAIKVTIPL